MKFSHLHNHTQYSLLDGASSIKKLYKKAVADQMPAVAITDHGNMFGVFDFVKEAKKYKDESNKPLIKPIVGCEFYVVTDRHIQQFSKEKKDVRYHQLLLAKNKIGYKNLMKLCSLGFTEGLYGKYPRIDKTLVEQYHEGLIATTCCLGASVPRTILKDGEEAGKKEFLWWLNLFGEDYYVELQRHDIPDQNKVNEILVKWAKEYKVKIIASNDSHYIDEEDSNAHDILLCVNTGELQSTPKMKDFDDEESNNKNSRFAFFNNQFYFKTTQEMCELFSDLPDSIDNTNEIVDKVELISVTNDLLLPNFPVPPQFKSQDEYLQFLTYEGAKIKYKLFTPELEERLQFELGVIQKMGFAGYFLIVSDIINSTKKMGVVVGPGRGSAAGSVVAFCIGITSIDPLKYNLLFERFLNPERATMPDIDTDFDDIGRGKVVEYIVDSYGRNQVAQIITYGTMAAKSSIKDVARVMDLPLEESNALAKLVPDKPGTSLHEILHLSETDLRKKEFQSEDVMNVISLQKIYHNTSDFKSTILHEAEKLEGTVRNTGIHAAGIIIGPKDLTEIMPLCKQKDNELYVTQFDGKVVEEAGAIKIDILGLNNLSIIRDAIIFIKENHDIDIDIANISLEDEKTFQLYQEARTEGTFQFASVGMQKYLKDLKPTNLEDLIAMNALYRPGPLEYIPEFVDRKHGRKTIEYDLPEMEEYLKETYGITVYQEQVMLLSQKLANFSKGDADILRKAMGKKQIDVLNKMQKKFFDGATENGHPLEKLQKIWNDWEAFAQYAFNKSHSTCYAYLAYQTAYLKANYPAEYMAALLNSQHAIEDIAKYMKECQKMNLPVLGPDINASKKGFSVDKNGVIRFGLGAIKGVGEAAVNEIISKRESEGLFTDIFDMVGKLSTKTVNRKTIESLIMAGAFDCFKEYHRAQYFYISPGEQMSGVDKIIKYAQQLSGSSAFLSNSLFGEEDMPEIPKPKLFDCEPWQMHELLEKEKEMVGIFITAHPLDFFKFELDHYGFTPLSDILEDKYKKKNLRVGGFISSAQHLISKKGTAYGRFKLIDYFGEHEFMLFSNDYIKYKDFLELDTKVAMQIIHQPRFYDENTFEVKIQSMMLLENVKKNLTKSLHVSLSLQKFDDTFLALINKYANPKALCEINVTLKDEESKELLKLNGAQKNIELSDEFIQSLQAMEHIIYKIETR
ncbi:MAG: DNA polymerase III subunit alpha [Chitinophagaceae bacterium]